MVDYLVKQGDGSLGGPFTATELRRLALTGAIDARTSFVSRADKDEWHPAGNVKGLFPSTDAESPCEANSETGQTASAEVVDDDAPVYLPPPIVVPAETTENPLLDELEDEPELVYDESVIWDRVHDGYRALDIQEEWFTPAGNQRSTPVYLTTVRNEYLNKVRNIRKGSYEELIALAEEQVEKWGEQEFRKRLAAVVAALMQEAEQRAKTLSQRAQATIAQIKNILTDRVDLPAGLQWSDYIDRRSTPEFAFEEPPAQPERLPLQPRAPKRNLLHRILPFLWEKELQRHRLAMAVWKNSCQSQSDQWQRQMEQWKERRAMAAQKHEAWRKQFRREQLARNKAVQAFQAALEQKWRQAIVRYIKEILQNSRYPETFSVSHDIGFSEETKTVVVNVILPNRHDVTDIVECRFVKTTGEAQPVFMKPKDHESLYDSAVKQTVIRTIHEVLSSTAEYGVLACVVNGWVNDVDPRTGHDRSTCVISVSSDLKKFMGLDLYRVDPTECIKNLKGLIAGPLSQVAPVQPIMQLSRDDGRFVESQAVLAEYNSTTNLVEIGWEEFEHLVRELFSKMFSEDGAEVRVTQASRDGGVDAIAFDPDPIRGGKFVIQAKRYTNVVPVSAVRDLYGTMISEGASKGILVTTSYYGPDSHEFAKEKPITLIDGSNLVYLLEKHGHKVRIDVQEARRKPGWNPLLR